MIRQQLKKIPFLKFLYINFDLAKNDFGARGWGTLCQALIRVSPDLFMFNFVRVIGWWIAGVKMKSLQNLVIRQDIFIENPSRLSLGHGVQINRSTYLGSNLKIEIGDFTRIAMNVSILTASHDGIHFEIDTSLPVVIGEHCHIGAGAIVLPGSILANGTMIAPGAVISGKTQEFGIYVGNPARMVGKRNSTAPVAN